MAWVVWQVAFLAPLAAQQPKQDEDLTLFVPLHSLTREELARREALELYALGLLRQHQDRLVEATRTFEEALHLDPDAAPIYQAIIPLYIAMSRTDDALAACRKTLDLDPGDYQTWSLYGRQLKNLGRLNEAGTALGRALACPGLREHVDLRMQLYYDLGALCEETQDLNQAVSTFTELVRILDDPQTALNLAGVEHADLGEEAASIYERIINICIQDHQYDRALSIFAQARVKHPVLARRLNYNLAKIYSTQAQPGKALEHLDEYLKTQPQGAEAYELRSAILRQFGRADEILAALAQYAVNDTFNVALHLLLAREYARAGQVASAEKVYKSLVDQSPTAEIFKDLFILYHQQRTMVKVVDLLDEALGKSEKNSSPPAGDAQAAAKARAMLTALREDPELIRAVLPDAQQVLLSGRDLHSQTLYLVAVLAGCAHELPEAEFFYRRCLESSSNNPQRQAAAYSGLIRVLWSARKFEAVVDLCRQGLRQAQATDSLLFRQYLSRALAILGKDEEAIAEADRAVESANDENRFDMRLSRIGVFIQAERYSGAIAEAQALAKQFNQPEQVRAVRDILHNVYAAMRDFTKAEEELRLILQADANDATANNNLGYLWADQGKNLEEAERFIRRALELDRQQKKIGTAVSIEDDADNAAFVDSLGWVLFREGRLEEARTWLEKATALTRGADDPTVWDHLGDVYFRQQKRAEARSAWQKSLLLYEAEKRHKTSDSYKELKHKLELLDSETH
jgi:tetratricopeptide (TPR) repeat protein